MDERPRPRACVDPRVLGEAVRGVVRDLAEHQLPGFEGKERVFQLVHPELPDDFPPLVGTRRCKHNLPVPKPRREAFCVKSRGHWRPEGICWFVSDAREMIARAFVLASLLDELGVPVRKVAAECPGTILYRDPWQVVAKPRRDEQLLFN